MARCGCGGQCNCVVIAGENVNVSGTGSPAHPYVVTAEIGCEDVRPCLSAGDGLDYDPATGEFTADLSGQAGNNIVIGPDGGLYVPAAAGATVVTAPADCITVSGDGSASSPITAAPVLDPAGRLTCGPDGMAVEPVETGCGLTGDGSAGSPITALTRTWAYPCDIGSTAGGVFCDDGGVLRSEPRTRVTYQADSGNEVVPTTVVPSSSDAVAFTRSLTLTNPDGCRPAIAYVTGTLDVDFTLPAGAGAAAGINGDELVRYDNTGSSTIPVAHTQLTREWRVTVPAGGSAVAPLDIEIGRGSGGATYSRVQWAITALVISV